MNASVDNSPTGQYLQLFSRTLSLYFAANTAPNEEGKYISSFKSQEFYDSFKNLVQAKYDADAIEKNVKLLKVEDVTDGQKANIEKIVANCKRKYQKTLPDMWQESLKKGVIDIDKLKGFTNKAYSEMMVNYGDKTTMDGYLTNMIAAQDAMRQIRDGRKGFFGWLWKLFHKEQNQQEKSYFSELTTKLNDLKIRGYKVDEKKDEVTGKTVFGKKLTEEKAKEQEKPAKKEEQPAKKSSKPAKIKPCSEKIEDNYYEHEIDEKIANELLSKISIKADDYRIRVLTSMVVKPAFTKDIKDLNEQFDQDVKNGNQNEAMAKLVRGVFKVADEYKNYIVGNSKLDRVQACGILAQTFINNLTAVSIYPQLEGIANEYIKNNIAHIISRYFFFIDTAPLIKFFLNILFIYLKIKMFLEDV